MPWSLRCLLCGEYTNSSLVDLQEHAMREHGYTQDDIRASKLLTPGRTQGTVLIYGFRDGVEWLEATPVPIAVEGTTGATE